jgi:hypothetical protein
MMLQSPQAVLVTIVIMYHSEVGEKEGQRVRGLQESGIRVGPYVR